MGHAREDGRGLALDREQLVPADSLRHEKPNDHLAPDPGELRSDSKRLSVQFVEERSV